MIQSGITTLNMSGTTEVPAISISAASQGTTVLKLRVDMTGASVYQGVETGYGSVGGPVIIRENALYIEFEEKK